MVTRSDPATDPGTENYSVANMQTIMRQRLDPSLVNALRHRRMDNGMNIKPEIQWSRPRSQISPGFEAVLQHGLDAGLLDMHEDLERCVYLESGSLGYFGLIECGIPFHRIAIPWLWDELDRWVDQKDSTTRRANKYKVLPHGIPDLIYECPEDYGAVDFKVCGC